MHKVEMRDLVSSHNSLKRPSGISITGNFVSFSADVVPFEVNLQLAILRQKRSNNNQANTLNAKNRIWIPTEME